MYCICFAKQVRYIVASIFNRAGQTYRESWQAKEKKAKKIKKKNPTTQTHPPPNPPPPSKQEKQENITKPRIFKIFKGGGGSNIAPPPPPPLDAKPLLDYARNDKNKMYIPLHCDKLMCTNWQILLSHIMIYE